VVNKEKHFVHRSSSGVGETNVVFNVWAIHGVFITRQIYNPDR
jgi:hypothetical protein